MYQIGDLIIYGNYGVCKVDAIGTLDIFGIDKNRLYYTINSLYHNEKIYTPIDTNVFMRPIITYEEVQQLITLIPSIEENEYNICGMRSLESYYQQFLQTHDCYDLLKLIKNIYIKNRKLVKNRKKLGRIDERFMQKAEDLLYGEFAVVLGIPKEGVKSYIDEKVIRRKSMDVMSSRGELHKYSK